MTETHRQGSGGDSVLLFINFYFFHPDRNFSSAFAEMSATSGGKHDFP